MFPCSEQISKRCICFMFYCPPKPYLMFLIVVITSHLVHFYLCFITFFLFRGFLFCTTKNINLNFFRMFFEICLVHLFRKTFVFFNMFVTVSLSIPKTRPVSLVPEPFVTIAMTFSFIPGSHALY